MKLLIILLAIITLNTAAISQTSAGKNSWQTKPVDQWDNDDIKAILRESPWSRTVTGDMPVISPFGAYVNKMGASFRLYSALNVRLAIYRKKQIDETYESMNSKKKAEFNKKYKDLVECPLCKKFYIVAIGGADSRTLQSVGAMKHRTDSIFLSNDKGEKRFLESYTPQANQSGEALFYFPRFNDKGDALLTPRNTTFSFNFLTSEDDELFLKFIRRVDTKVSDIVVDGQVIF